MGEIMILENKLIQSLAFGTEYTETAGNKIIFSRFSEQERNRLSYGKDNSWSTAGVRIEFQTDSKYISIAVSTKKSNPHTRNFYSFDVLCNGIMLGQIKNFNNEPQYPYKKYNLEDRQKAFYLKMGMKHICICFPWSVQGMIRKIELDDKAVIKPIQKAEKVIMYGDSITQGYDAVSSSLSYASILADKLNANIINKGIGGSVFMPELTKHKGDILPKFITVAYGTNDWRGSDFEDFKNRCFKFYKNLAKNYPNVPIFALAPIWRADTNETHKLSSFSLIADTLRKLATYHKNIHFINGINFIPNNTVYYRDYYLHPNDAGFKIYADSLLKELNKKFLHNNKNMEDLK